ncbi:hypothetical protein [Oscillatoria sp. CS-180]|uniref:hypothetical protein n=1 Tax=Oscillatoria sp. CS-180 TaxID=3021720 RepID=UPI00232F81DD|nr:hypothetical protein [Oscillatoria sp. CS-180]
MGQLEGQVTEDAAMVFCSIVYKSITRTTPAATDASGRFHPHFIVRCETATDGLRLI